MRSQKLRKYLNCLVSPGYRVACILKKELGVGESTAFTFLCQELNCGMIPASIALSLISYPDLSSVSL